MVKQNHASSEEQIFCFPSISNLAPYAPWCFMPLSFENVLCALVNVFIASSNHFNQLYEASNLLWDGHRLNNNKSIIFKSMGMAHHR